MWHTYFVSFKPTFSGQSENEYVLLTKEHTSIILDEYWLNTSMIDITEFWNYEDDVAILNKFTCW